MSDNAEFNQQWWCILKVHTIERLNSRQVCNPVFVFENDVAEVANIECIMVILQHL